MLKISKITVIAYLTYTVQSFSGKKMGDYLSWDDSSSDEEEYFERERRQYKMRIRIDMESWDDVDFFCRFRLRKETVAYVLELVRPALEFREQR